MTKQQTLEEYKKIAKDLYAGKADIETATYYARKAKNLEGCTQEELEAVDREAFNEVHPRS